MTRSSTPAQPTEIRLDRAAALLRVRYDTEEAYDLPLEYLRVESPSAEVQGHGPGQRMWFGGKRGVGVTAIEPVGQYAIRLIFDDGHDSGLFTWEYLRELGQQHDTRWAAYLDALAARGLSR